MAVVNSSIPFILVIIKFYGWGQKCAVFLNKTLNSHSTSLHTQFYEWVLANLIFKRNRLMDQDTMQVGNEILVLLVISWSGKSSFKRQLWTTWPMKTSNVLTGKFCFLCCVRTKASGSGFNEWCHLWGRRQWIITQGWSSTFWRGVYITSLQRR